jgi:hypothetical protein
MRRNTRSIMTVFVLLLSLVTLPAAAASFEAGLGVSQYNADRDGLWYQEGYPHTLDLNTTAVTIGVTGDVPSWRALSWHIDAVDLGNVSSSAWATARDAAYNTSTHHGNVPLSKCADFIGSGKVYGVSGTLGAYVDAGQWRFSADVGGFVYKATWNETINHWHAPGQPGHYQDISASHAVRWELGPVAGLSVSYGRWSLQYRYYIDPANGDQYPAIYSKTQTLSIIVRF